MNDWLLNYALYIALAACALLFYNVFFRSKEEDEVKENILVIGNDLLYKIQEKNYVINEENMAVLCKRLDKSNIYIANHVVNPDTPTLLDCLWNAGLSRHSSSFPKERILFFMKNVSVSFFVNLLHINTVITDDRSYLSEVTNPGVSRIVCTPNDFGKLI